MESFQATVEVNNLSFSYDSVEVLHGISFCIKRCEMIGLLGPNGAGKTTTLKVLAGLLPPACGCVRIAGFDLPKQHISAKRVIGYLPEAAEVYQCLSGVEFLELVGRLHSMDEKLMHTRIGALLKAFDLDGAGIPQLSGFSKGMRQKVLLSAALLHNPDVLLLDEPLSGLDVGTSILIKEILAALAAHGKTILYSSHVLDVVEKLCHRILVIDGGKLIADAPLDDLKSKTREKSLEDVFRKLTHSEDLKPKVDRVLEALNV